MFIREKKAERYEQMRQDASKKEILEGSRGRRRL